MKNLALTLPGGENIAPPAGVPIPTGGLFPTGENIIQGTLNIIFVFAILLALAALIYNALQIILSEGEKQKLAQARQGLIFSIVGLVVILLATFVIRIIGTFFGVELIK